MQSQDLEKEKLIDQLEKIVKSKENHSGKRIRYDWKAAEMSLLSHKSLVHHERQKHILQLLLQLQTLYSAKFIPAFYSYYTILSILERNIDICEEIQQQINRTNQTENNYQNIALLIHMRRKQLKEFVEMMEYREEEVQKLRNSTILSIIKTQEWEQEVASFVEYPVFFLWEEEPYLLSLDQTVEGAFINKNQKEFLSEPNLLFLKVSEKQDDIVIECLSILKMQRARSLQFSLNLPFFARNKLQTPIKLQGKTNQQILKLQNSLNFSKRKVHSTYSNAKTIFPSISKEQLNVIQKFRSLKNMKNTVKQPKPSVVDYEHLFDNKLKRRIDDLKEKVKIKTQTSQIHEGNQSRHITIKEKIRKASLEKPVSTNNHQTIDKRPIVDTLNTLKEDKPRMMPFLKSSSKQSLKDKRQINQQKMDSIIKQTKFLIKSRTKQQEQLQAKNQSLQTLKQDLLQKVKEKNNLIKPQRPNVAKDSTKNEKYKYRQKSNQHAKLKEKKQIFTRVDNEKKLLQQRNRSLIQQKARIEEQFLKKYKELTERQKTSKQISNRLSMKKLKVKNLADKLEETKNKTIEEIENPSASIEIEKLKKKKQMQYQLEKEKIKQVQNSLESRVKQEAKRLASLEQEQSKREAQIQRQFQEQVNKLKAKHEEQQSKILQKIKQEAEKQELYEKKIKQQEDRLEYMSKEMQEWQRKQRQLQLSLREQERKQQQKQAALRAQRKRRIDRQMEQLQQQQIQFLNKYKQTNQHLIDQLQQLKAKNHQLEQVLSFNE